ncbi:MAG: amidohydrolase family protein [Gemmatimonadetes bacterium]|nr:amidohydrolase family protein [Gemmatimonadota bacterium]
MTRWAFATITLIGVALALRVPRRAVPLTTPAPTGVVDHHVHILSPDLVRDWKSLGVPFSRPDSIYTSAASLLSGRDDSVAATVLVPMGHLYANPEFIGGLAIDTAEAHGRVRRENRWVAAEAARFPGRATALCSVPAIASWALEDLAWCRDSLHTAGIKLHLASSQVDLRDAAHLDRLRLIAAFATAHHLPILLHVDPQRRGHDSTHIRALAERAFAPHPELTVIIAHLGGSGGYGPWTRTVYRTLRTWLNEIEATGPVRRVYFELSAVVLERPSEGVPATTTGEATLLREDLRRHGFDRVVFGSDYPVFDPLDGARALTSTLGLTAAEAAGIVRRVPGLTAPAP